MVWALTMGAGAYTYYFVLPRGDDGKPSVPSAGSAPKQSRPPYDLEAERRLLDEMAAAQRKMWEAYLERLAASGASDETIALERAAAERSMAKTNAGFRPMRARTRREIWGEAAAAGGAE